jgi:uncharacterized protein YdiU (UPF0061 family)
MNAASELSSGRHPAWRDDTFFDRLGPGFATPVDGQGLPQPHWVVRNTALAQALGLGDWLDTPQALQALAGHGTPSGRTPLASVYSGHQFGVWAGQLGDGRALLLGELATPLGPQELQLKGAGRTPYSRGADGRAVLRSSVREYLCSEAMHALAIPTTRALALVGSALPVRRETVETAAVVARVAPSFLRFGHFEHFTHTARDVAALRRLVDGVIDEHYPAARGAPQPVLALLAAVVQRTAALLADWQAVGFCHGVMNTDNLSILGLTIDYGPFGFLDAFDPGHICNHSDQQGRYAYARQPSVAFWNLAALAQALLPLVPGEGEAAVEPLRDVLETYKAHFATAMTDRMRAKLGLATAQDGDADLADDLLRLMAQDRSDYTLTMRSLATIRSAPELDSASATAGARAWFIDRAGFDTWAARYLARLRAEGSVDAERAARMNRSNPLYVLRNHLAETAIRRASEGDFSEVQRLATVLAAPFDEQPGAEDCAALPPDWAQQLEVSCSS